MILGLRSLFLKVYLKKMFADKVLTIFFLRNLSIFLTKFFWKIFSIFWQSFENKILRNLSIFLTKFWPFFDHFCLTKFWQFFLIFLKINLSIFLTKFWPFLTIFWQGKFVDFFWKVLVSFHNCFLFDIFDKFNFLPI